MPRRKVSVRNRRQVEEDGEDDDDSSILDDDGDDDGDEEDDEDYNDESDHSSDQNSDSNSSSSGFVPTKNQRRSTRKSPRSRRLPGNAVARRANQPKRAAKTTTPIIKHRRKRNKNESIENGNESQILSECDNDSDIITDNDTDSKHCTDSSFSNNHDDIDNDHENDSELPSNSSDDENDDGNSDDNDKEEVDSDIQRTHRKGARGTRVTRSRASAKNAKKNLRKQRVQETTDDEDESSDDEDGKLLRKSSRAYATRINKHQRGNKKVTNSDHVDNNNQNSRNNKVTLAPSPPLSRRGKRDTPSRGSATKANQKLAKMQEGSDDDKEDHDGNQNSKRKLPIIDSKRRKAGSDDDDEEYSNNDEDDDPSESEEESSYDDDDDGDDSVIRSGNRQQPGRPSQKGTIATRRKLVKEAEEVVSDFLSMDDTSDDNEQCIIQTPPQLEIRKVSSGTRAKKSGMFSDSSDEEEDDKAKTSGMFSDSSDEEEDDKAKTCGAINNASEEEDDKKKRAKARNHHNCSNTNVIRFHPQIRSPPKLPKCPSVLDEITMEKLPLKHVCFVTPDQKSRQCFALETLHKIATTSSKPLYHNDPLDATKQIQSFLQPPHFRTAMSDDLMDQIASRFGRQALDIHGDFYNNKRSISQINHCGEADNDDVGDVSSSDEEYRVCFGGALDDDIEFEERLQRRKEEKEAGKSNDDDTVSDKNTHHQQEQGKEEEDIYNFEFQQDPMTVLGFPDNEDYKIAASFCFKKLSGIKHHLRVDHKVDTSIVDGNTLYMRFKVRTQDGLLQQYLNKGRGRNQSYQGDMRRYWHYGNSQTYIFLLDLMEKAESYRIILDDIDDDDDDDDNDENDSRKMAKEFMSPAKDFFRSYEREVERLWKSIVAPYRKVDKKELANFIYDGEVEEGDNERPHFLIQNELNRTFKTQSQGHSDSAEDDSEEERQRLVNRYEQEGGNDEISWGDEGDVEINDDNDDDEDFTDNDLLDSGNEDKEADNIRDDHQLYEKGNDNRNKRKNLLRNLSSRRKLKKIRQGRRRGTAVAAAATTTTSLLGHLQGKIQKAAPPRLLISPTSEEDDTETKNNIVQPRSSSVPPKNRRKLVIAESDEE